MAFEEVELNSVLCLSADYSSPVTVSLEKSSFITDQVFMDSPIVTEINLDSLYDLEA